MEQVQGILRKDFKRVKGIPRPYKPPTGKTKAETMCEEKYGLSRKEMDIILTELCLQYNCQWAVVSSALYSEHNIMMNESRIKDRFVGYLDPRLNKNKFTPEEKKKMFNLYFVHGYRYRDMRKAFPFRDRNMIKAVLEVGCRRAVRKIERYVSDFIETLPKEQRIAETQTEKTDLIRGFISESKIQFKYNQSAFKLIYFFMMTSEKEHQKIPKQLAILLYKRLVQLKKERDYEKESRFNQIDPCLNQIITEAVGKQKGEFQSSVKIEEGQAPPPPPERKRRGRKKKVYPDQPFLDFDISDIKIEAGDLNFDEPLPEQKSQVQPSEVSRAIWYEFRQGSRQSQSEQSLELDTKQLEFLNQEEFMKEMAEIETLSLYDDEDVKIEEALQ